MWSEIWASGWVGRAAKWVAVSVLGAGAVALVLWVAIGPGALWVLESADGVKGLTGKDRAEALDRVRGRAIAIGTGLIALIAIYFTARTAHAALASSAAAQQTAAATEQGMVTGRYTAAITQLGDKDSLDIRLGGIYALERIATDSMRDDPVIAEVLATFVRGHLEDDDARRSLPEADPQRYRLRADLRAALAVLGRRSHDNNFFHSDLSGLDLHQLDLSRITLARTNLVSADLSGADLHDANLYFADLRGADLTGADLRGAKLGGTDLRGAKLGGAKLGGTDLRGVDLRDADLRDADLRGAKLDGMDLRGVDLRDADLSDAKLGGAKLDGMDLRGVDLRDADLRDANLRGADLGDADLSGADLRGAKLGDADHEGT